MSSSLAPTHVPQNPPGESSSYLQEMYFPHDEVLEKGYRACLQHPLAAFQAKPATAKMFERFLAALGARKVVEIGTILGYTATRMAAALPPGGMIWTLARDHREGTEAWQLATSAGVGQRVVGMLGGTAVLPVMTQYGPFDAVVLSADVGNYANYGQWASSVLRPGGLLLVNHADPTASPYAEAVRSLHEHIRRDYDVTYIPTAEGVLHATRRPAT